MAKKKKPSPKKTNSAVKTTWMAVAVLAGFAAIVTLCIWLNRPGPLDSLTRTGANTIFAENFTAVYELDVNGVKMDGLINAAIVPEEKQLDVFLQFSSPETDYEGGIYQGTLVLVSAKDESIQTMDISSQVDQFFTLLDGGQPDWSVLLDFSKFNLHEGISKDFEFDTFMSCLGNWLNDLNNAKWAEKHAGFTKTAKDGIITYSYDPQPYDFVQKTVPMFKKAFRDSARYNSLNDYIESAQFLFKDGNADFSFSTKDDQLVEAEFRLKYNNTDVTGHVSFIGINGTIVDIEQVAFYIKEAGN